MDAWDLLFALVRLALGCWLLWRLRDLPARQRAGGGGAHPGRPGCSVVIPARNEAGVLARTVGAVVAQLGPDDEVVVVDDHSTDATAEVARAAGARVVVGAGLPDGWTGKAWACQQGAAHTDRPLVCFLDADTTLAPDGLDRVAVAVVRTGGMVSVQPYHEVPTVAEKLSAYFNVVALMGVDAFTPLGDRVAPSGAFGPVLAVTRADYEALGGHGPVAAEVLDDLALAQRWHAAGRPVACFAGRSVARFRMYPGGLRALAEGWTKNMAAGAGSIRLATTLAVFLWISLQIQSTWLLATAWSLDALGPAAALYAVVAVQLWWMLRRVGSFGPITALAFPLPLVVFLAVFGRSAFRLLRRGPVRWKGRDLPTTRVRSGAAPPAPWPPR